jgi:protein-tyrosine phosphatase
LGSVGVTTVIDLRIPDECSDHPDTKLKGTKYIWQPLLTTPSESVYSEGTMRRLMKTESYRLKWEFEDADSYMLETYRSILFQKEPQESLKNFLNVAITQDGCLLWHCTSGKDRSGICAMLLEGLLGVSDEDIVNDYMASRKCLRARYTLNKVGLAIVPVSLRFKRILFCFMRTKISYIQTVLRELKVRYGGIIDYCKKELGITDGDIAILRQKYLV